MTAPSPWLLVADVVTYSRVGKRDVLAALADGSLRGHQIKAGGKWRVHRDDVDSWLRGEAPVPLREHIAKARAS